MEVKWIVLNKNIGTGNYVAAMLRKHKNKKDNSDYILTIYEDKEGYRICYNQEYSIFSDYTIPYDEVYYIVNATHPNLSKKQKDRLALLHTIITVQDNFEQETSN